MKATGGVAEDLHWLPKHLESGEMGIRSSRDMTQAATQSSVTSQTIAVEHIRISSHLNALPSMAVPLVSARKKILCRSRLNHQAI